MLRRVLIAMLLALVLSAATAYSHTTIYFDQNEEEQFWVDPTGPLGVLVPTWDTNGQMSIFPGTTGRFVTGYNPTLKSEGLGTFPLMDPPVGEAVWDIHGHFTGDTIFVPGPWANPGSSVGGDIPPDTTKGCVKNSNGTMSCPGPYNNNGTYLGAVFDAKGHLFAGDIGQAQGQFPPPDNGRAIEWFPPTYTTYCILIGPTMGGDSKTGHHVDGTGGLRDPGIFAVDSAGNLYVPEAGQGRVLEFLSSSFPTSAVQCPGPSNMPKKPVSHKVFIQGSGFLSAIARDPSVNKWAVSNVLSNVIKTPAVQWYNDDGTLYTGKGPLPSGNYSPFGLAFTPSGNLYFVDIHIVCSGGGCGPADHGGHVYRVSFKAGIPSTPVAVAKSLNFPASVTSCDTSVRICPK